MKCENGAEVDT